MYIFDVFKKPAYLVEHKAFAVCRSYELPMCKIHNDEMPLFLTVITTIFFSNLKIYKMQAAIIQRKVDKCRSNEPVSNTALFHGNALQLITYPVLMDISEALSAEVRKSGMQVQTKRLRHPLPITTQRIGFFTVHSIITYF